MTERNLYEVTGDIKDINTLLVNREEWNRRAQPAQAVHLHQALTDPENQPNQYGVEFFMHGPKFAFKVGTQQFTLDYEPTEPGEFEFMQAALIYAFSVFTPDVKTAQAVPVLTDDTALIRQLDNALARCRFDSLNMSIADMKALSEARAAASKRLGIVGKEGA